MVEVGLSTLRCYENCLDIGEYFSLPADELANQLVAAIMEKRKWLCSPLMGNGYNGRGQSEFNRR